ncbi:hypothetical protein D3C78_1787900 [compost metagenome]
MIRRRSFTTAAMTRPCTTRAEGRSSKANPAAIMAKPIVIPSAVLMAVSTENVIAWLGWTWTIKLTQKPSP